MRIRKLQSDPPICSSFLRHSCVVADNLEVRIDREVLLSDFGGQAGWAIAGGCFRLSRIRCPILSRPVHHERHLADAPFL